MQVKNVLCFAPHPDDEILGCGGSIIKLIDAGCKICICYLSYGEFGSPIVGPQKMKEIRKEEVFSVAKLLKIPLKNIYFLAIPDNQISRYDIKNFKLIIRLIREIKPDLVYLPQ